MGGSSSQKTTTVNTPWSEQTPYLKYGMEEAAKLYQRPGPQYYPGSTIAPFSSQQQQAFNLGQQRALAGNQTMQGAEQFTRDVLGGNYLNSNPYNDQVFQNIQSKVMPAVNSNFMGAGRYGSGLHGDTMTRALTESYAPYASQQWQSGLDRMGQAASAAPVFAANDYTDIGYLENIGRARQALAQQELDDARARWDFYQNQPYEKLAQYQGGVTGNFGGTQTSKIPGPSMFSQLLGGGVSLLGSALAGGLF